MTSRNNNSRFVLVLVAVLALLAGGARAQTPASPFNEGDAPNFGSGIDNGHPDRILEKMWRAWYYGSVPLPVSTTTIATTPFSTEALSSTPVLVGTAGSRNIYSIKFTNPTAATVYVHSYDAATAGAVTVGTTTQKDVWEVPANSQTWLAKNGQTHGAYASGIVIAVTTGPLSTSTSAPASAIIAKIDYN